MFFCTFFYVLYYFFKKCVLKCSLFLFLTFATSMMWTIERRSLSEVTKVSSRLCLRGGTWTCCLKSALNRTSWSLLLMRLCSNSTLEISIDCHEKVDSRQDHRKWFSKFVSGGCKLVNVPLSDKMDLLKFGTFWLWFDRPGKSGNDPHHLWSYATSGRTPLLVKLCTWWAVYDVSRWSDVIHHGR